MTCPDLMTGAVMMNALTTTTRSRSLWLERLAHALPYLMFAAAMLLLDRLSRGATQESRLPAERPGVGTAHRGGLHAGEGVELIFTGEAPAAYPPVTSRLAEL